MSFSCGIIGLPNSGKSTIFNALTSLSVPAQPYPFCTIEPNAGVVIVPDDRFLKLAQLLKPEKVTPTTIEFIDIAGLIKDAHKGEGLGNKFLSHIRNVDAVAHVIRCFSTKNVPHIYSEINPARDVEVVETELIIADLEIIEERLDKIERMARVSKEKGEAEKALLIKIKTLLEKGMFIEMEGLSEPEKDLLRSFSLIVSKPMFYIANVDEESLNNFSESGLEKFIKAKGKKVVYICGKLEQDISCLPDNERASYMEMYGIREMSVLNVIRTGYEMLGLITFYTVVGKEMRAWTIPKNTGVARAAGKIHSDMEKGFIKAEVLDFEDFVRCGSEHITREKGLLRIEGREYVVKDGDIIHIRFNV